ncbi:MAG TPA: J domain-containing protein [Luteitalea sp.]|nr:J domain-containing protein [Luteitalea sp.]
MGARLGFADVLLSKLADVPPPPAAPGERMARIASPSWVHRLEPLRAASATVFHSRYAHPASAAPGVGGIPVDATREPRRGGSTAPFEPVAPPVTPVRRAPRNPRERVGIELLNRLGANINGAASDEQIRSAYRRLLRESHPDMHPTADAHALDGHTRKLRAVVRAWEVFEGRAAA